MRKKALHLIVGLNNGGAEASLCRLCFNLESWTHVVVSLTDSGFYGAQLKSHGVKLYELGIQKDKVFSYFKILRLFLIIRHETPSIVQSWMYHANISTLLVKLIAPMLPVAWSIHNSALMPGINPQTTFVASNICAFFSRIIPSCLIYCANSSMRAHLSAGFENKRCIVIPNGYDFEIFRSRQLEGDALRSNLLGKDANILLGMVARCHPVKDHNTLFRSLAILKEHSIKYKCILVGPGTEDVNLELMRLLGRYSILEDVILYGPSTDIPLIMSAIDIHVLSSKSEAFPNVLIEALACCTPCVTTAVGDAPEIISSYGLTCGIEDPTEMAGCILRLIKLRSNASKWSSLCHGGRAHVLANYGLGIMSESYSSCWNAILKPSR